MSECFFNNWAVWVIGMMPQMGLVLISVMTVTGDGVYLSHVHPPALCPHTEGRVMLIDKMDKNTTGGIEGCKIKRDYEKRDNLRNNHRMRDCEEKLKPITKNNKNEK